MTTPSRGRPENVRPLHPDAAMDVGPVDPLAEAWTAEKLMNTSFPEPRWAVPGIIPEGAALLAGPPKIGKSWFSLATGLAVAAGTPALGGIPVEPGPVLYLALEDTPRRLKRRIGKILAGNAAPPGLTLATTCPPLPDGGDAAIARWLTRHPDARMVIIDVFAKMRGAAPPGMSAYDADYAAVGRAKRLADDFGVAFVLVHHVRKAAADDFLAEVSGTNGMAGAADTVLVLKRSRGTADGLLHTTGRDIDETEQAMAFDTDTGTWQLLDGDPVEHAVADTRASILAHLRDHPRQQPKAISDALNLERDLIRRTCSRMAADGQLYRDGDGYYLPTDPLGQVGHQGTVPRVPAVPPKL